MNISAQCIVKNEDKWIWYAINSVIDHVDSVDVVDTGSTDNTIKIIKSINNSKISLIEDHSSTADQITEARQRQLSRCKSDWILILDGDEVWPTSVLEESIKNITSSKHLGYLINKYTNLVGDVYHRQPDFVSRYRFGKTIGPYTIRFVNRNIFGLHWQNPYGFEGLTDFSNRQLQDTSIKNFKIASPYLHLTHLSRSTLGSNDVYMRNGKLKYEIGLPVFPKTIYPKSFYISRPPLVPSPWQRPDVSFWCKAILQTPVRYIKRLVSYA